MFNEYLVRGGEGLLEGEGLFASDEQEEQLQSHTNVTLGFLIASHVKVAPSLFPDIGSYKM